MTVRNALVALLLIVALLGAVVMLLDEPSGSFDDEAGTGRADQAAPAPATAVTPVPAALGADEPDLARLTAQSPLIAEGALEQLGSLLATGEVRGRLLDVRGQPIPGEPVDLLVSDDAWRTLLRRNDLPEVVDRGVSDADGRFVLAARAGALQQLRAGGLHWARNNGIGVTAGDEVEIELVDGLVLSGSVVAQESGLPVAGAWVGSFSGTDKLLTRTDKRGFFSLGPLPDDIVRIGAFLEGYDIGRSELVAPSWGRVEIELPPGRTIDGRVVERRSNVVIPGASVSLQLTSSGRDVGKPDPLQGQRTLVEWTAVTDDEGRFSLDGCPSSQFRVTVKADGFVPSGTDRYADRVLGKEQLLTIMLNPAETLTGTVIVAADGSPAEGARVQLAGASGRVPGASATVAADGSFRLELSSWDGRGALVVSSVDDLGRRASHRVRKRSRPIELSLVEPLVLDVLVTGPDGPRPGAQVALTSDEAEPTLALTDGSGRARLAHALAGPDIRTALVQARFGAAQSLPQALLLGEPLPEGPLILDLTAGAWISGVVQDIYGRPLPRAMVVVRNGSFGRADGVGRFSVGPVDVQPGETVTLLAQADGYRSTSLADVSAHEKLVLTLEEVVTWQGRVSDATTGEPIEMFNGRVLIETFESGSSAWRTGAVSRLAGAPGEFIVELDEAGTVKLQLRAPDFISGESLPVLFDGLNPPAWADILLSRAALLDVTVTDGLGRPVQGYLLRAVPGVQARQSAAPQGKQLKAAKSSRTGSDGKVRFNLGSGGLFRLASGPGIWLEDREVNVRPGPPTERYLNVGGTGAVSVVVRDGEGEFILRPKASVHTVGSGQRHSVKRRLNETKDGEELVAAGLPEGRYLIEVAQRGYSKVSREILVTVGGVAHAEFVLAAVPRPGKGAAIDKATLKVLQELGYLGRSDG